MKALVSHLVAGFVSLFVALSAWAGGSSGSGNFLIAPQLAFASNGPITATFLGATGSFPFGFGIAGFAEPITAFNLFLSGSGTEPGTQDETERFAAGTNFALAATVFPSDGRTLRSATGTTNTFTMEFLGIFNAPHLQNAAVLPISGDRVLVGFNPFGLPLPSSFDGFTIRIGLSNVCVK